MTASRRPAEESPIVIDSSDQEEDEDADASLARSTEGFCRICKQQVGEFYNSWVQVTGSYYLPALESSYRLTGVKRAATVQKASSDSSLAGCNVQSLTCTGCDKPLGVSCVSAPNTKLSYSDRELFKLPRIQLRSDATGKPVDAVIVRIAKVEQSQRDDSARSTASAMEPPVAVAPPPPPLPLAVQQKSTDTQQRRDSVPAQLSPTPVAPSPLQQQAPSDRSSTQTPAQRPHEHIVPITQSVNGHAQTHRSPTQHDVAMDAIHRLQTQNSYNTAALQNIRTDFQREIQSMAGTVGRLQADMRTVGDILQGLREELNARPWLAAIQQQQPPPPAPPVAQTDDRAIEYLAEGLQSVSAKANEVDALKIQVEMLKRKIRRLEEGGPSPRPGAFPSSQGEVSVHQTPVPVAHPASQMPFVATPIHTEVRPLSSHLQHPPPPTYSPDVAPPPQHLEPQPGGWVTVNQSVKRGLPNGVDDGANGAGTPLGSPKRPKLAPIEPRRAYDAASAIVHDRMDTGEGGAGFRTNSHGSYAESTNSSTFVPYKSTSEANPEDSWRPELQRPPPGPIHEPRSPKRGGRGGPRGPRGRKSLPLPSELEAGTPEWEKSDWSGSQVGPDGFYQPITPGNKRGMPVRRGSGGGGTASARQVYQDPYAHTKKSRTKPIRNAEGILIRKDGRPDMRSQSSAANLRKVHARKEQEKAQEQAHTPTSGLATAPVINGDSPSTDGDEEPGTQDRHEAIMRKIFPHGVDEQRDRMNYAEQFFPSMSSPIQSKMRLQKEMEKEKLREEAEPAEAAPENASSDGAPVENGAVPADSLQEKVVPETQQTQTQTQAAEQVT